MISLFLLLLFVVLCSWWLLGRLTQILQARSIVDQPNERSLHQGQVPRGGGLVIVFFLLLGLLGMGIWGTRPQTFAGLFGLLLGWALLSWWDDRHDLSPRHRFGVQLVLAVCTVLAFGYIDDVQLSEAVYVPLGLFGAFCSVVGILWLTNLYNFMDGMDGLAASQTIVACLTFAVWLWAANDVALSVCCLILAAASYGFLLRNWHPASIFMGDVGSITIGAFFATLFVYLNTRYEVPLLALLILFAVFIADASVTILRRLLKGEKIWLPHRTHFYQRAAALGFAHDRIVLVSVVLMLLCAVLASFVVADRDRIPMAVGAISILLAATMLAVAGLERARKRADHA